MKKILTILLCAILLVVPMSITASAQIDSGTLNVAGGEDYLVDVGIGHYAYSTYSVRVPIFVMTNQPNIIEADMSNFDSNYALSCYVTNADNESRIVLYADDYHNTGNAISVVISTDNGVMSPETKLLHKFHSTKGSEYPTSFCQFEIGCPVPLNGDTVASGNYNGTLSLRFTCECA